MRLYAIGDIHGQRDMLRAAHERIAADRKLCGDAEAPVVHLGDLGDRGPDTKGVLSDLIAGMAAGQPWLAIRGNHDQLFLDFLDFDGRNDPMHDTANWWLRPNLGGPHTLASYGIDTKGRDAVDLQAEARERVPPAHRTFLEALPLYHETQDLICVHAGIRPGIPLHRQDKQDLIWIRDEFLNDPRDHGKLVVHGHTPVERPEHAGNHVNLDTGAGFFRPLTVAVFEGRDCWVLTDDGRVPLRP